MVIARLPVTPATLRCGRLPQYGMGFISSIIHSKDLDTEQCEGLSGSADRTSPQAHIHTTEIWDFTTATAKPRPAETTSRQTRRSLQSKHREPRYSTAEGQNSLSLSDDTVLGHSQ
jgi:hypothetical protein